MKRDNYLEKMLVIVAICLLIMPSIPVVISDTSNSDSSDSYEYQNSGTGETDYFTNCIVIVFGKCNTVTGPLIWRFGFYCPLLKRSFWIIASGEEGESLNVIIRDDKFATYYDYEEINIQLIGANGFLFWGGKSILFNNTIIFARCKANQAWVTTYD